MYIPKATREQIKDQLREFERTMGMDELTFVAEYFLDYENERWTPQHHYWATLLEVLYGEGIDS